MNKEEQINQSNWMLLIIFLDKIRQDKDITHEQLAEKTGLIRSTVSRFFGLRFCPSLKLFITIARALDINFFFEDKGSTTSPLNVLFEKAMDDLGRRVDRLPKN